jgi:hypothetical protein
MKKKLFKDIIIWSVYGAIIAWTIASFINVNMSNVGEAEIAAWNLFEIASNWAEVVKG